MNVHASHLEEASMAEAPAGEYKAAAKTIILRKQMIRSIDGRLT